MILAPFKRLKKEALCDEDGNPRNGIRGLHLFGNGIRGLHLFGNGIGGLRLFGNEMKGLHLSLWFPARGVPKHRVKQNCFVLNELSSWWVVRIKACTVPLRGNRYALPIFP